MQSILPETYSEENQIKSQTGKFFDQYRIGTLLRQSNFDKEKGFSCFNIFRFIFMRKYSVNPL